MKSWRKSIALAHPLRGVVPIGMTPDAGPSPTSADVEAARKEGYERGRADAEREIGEQLVRQRAEVNQVVAGVVESIKRVLPQVIRETEQHLVALALDIARKLVVDVPVTVEMVEAAVREALAEVEGASEFHVRVHPEDLDLLKKTESEVFAPTADGSQVRFHAAPEVTRGGCMVQTRFGVIDGRRETRFELLKKSLLE